MSFSHRWEKQEEKIKKKLKKKENEKEKQMEMRSDGDSWWWQCHREIVVCYGGSRRETSHGWAHEPEREIHPIVFGFKFGFEIWVVFGCKESVRKSREIFLVHAFQLFYFIF